MAPLAACSFPDFAALWRARCPDKALQFHAIVMLSPARRPLLKRGPWVERQGAIMDQRGAHGVSVRRLVAGVVFAVGTALLVLTYGSAAAESAAASAADSVDAIKVVGNRRVEAATVRSYFRAQNSAAPDAKTSETKTLDSKALDAGLKALYASGLFVDAKITHTADGVTVTVVEAPVIDRIAFE